MAGGTSRRSGPTLADRLAASRGGATPALEVPDAPRERAVVTRHCWVSGLADSPGRHPGLLVEWRHDPARGRWSGRVVYAVAQHGRAVLVEQWVPAEHLTPA